MQVKTELLEPVLLEIVPGFHMWNVEGVAQALEMGPQQKVRRTKQGQDSCAKLEQIFLKCILPYYNVCSPGLTSVRQG